MEARRDSDHPSLPELRAVLIPVADEDQWDAGELPRAVCRLESQAVLRECRMLLRLACVARCSLDETVEARAVALREVLLDLLPKDLDDPCCQVLRVLAGLEPGTAGRRREQRQEAAGWRLGSDSQPATSRTVRRYTKQRCWPWLLDRLIEREVQERKVPPIHPETAPPPAEAAWTRPPDPMLWMPWGGWGEDLLLYHGSPGLPQPSEEWGRYDNDVKRRTFVLGVPAAFVASRTRLWEPLWSRLEAAALDAGTLDELAAAVARDGRLHDRLGSRAVYGSVTEHLRLATDLLRTFPPATLRPRLAAIAGEAAVEAGLICCDQRWFPSSRTYYRMASELAKEADDPLLGAFALGSLSSNLLTEVGDRSGAVSVLEGARTLAARGGGSRTEAYLAAVEAEAQSRLGDADASLRALDRIDGSMDRDPENGDLPWLYWFDPGVVAGWKGQSYLRLGRLDEAETLLAAALSSWDPSFVRDRAITLVDLASLRLRQGEIEECCRLAGESLEVAVMTASARLVQRVRALRAEIPGGSGSAGVRALDERLATAVWV